ncbi:hypothetical protein [Paeniglutamicibacter sp.]|uniref:hypothetical protein n=1 Tax=Paeniglutamicibacter sp. TaxID=1934391 RepID=UPI0039890A4F
MKQGLPMETRQELVGGFAAQNAKGTKVQKGVMLDGLCELSGWSRAKARRHLAAEVRKPARDIRCDWRGAGRADPVRRPSRYWGHSGRTAGNPEGKSPWPPWPRSSSGWSASTNLGPGLLLTDEVRDELLSMSAGTVDRYLKPLRAARYPSALSATKPGAMLCSKIPARWSGTSMERERGFYEIDTVAHCENNRAHRNVVAGIDMLAAALRQGGESRMHFRRQEVWRSGVGRSRLQPTDTFSVLDLLSAVPLHGVPEAVPRVLARGVRPAEGSHQMVSAVRVLWP